MTVKCENTIDFYNNGVTFECDREEGHTGRHAYRGEWAIISWSDR